MAKCGICVGCLKFVIVDNKRYLVCPFCKIVYKASGKDLSVVIDNDIIQKVAEQKGWKLE